MVKDFLSEDLKISLLKAEVKSVLCKDQFIHKWFFYSKKHAPSPAHTEVWGHVGLLFDMINCNLALYIVIIKMVMVFIMTMYIVIINMSLIKNMVMLINLTIYLKMIMKMSMIITIVMMIIMAMRYVWLKLNRDNLFVLESYIILLMYQEFKTLKEIILIDLDISKLNITLLSEVLTQD